MYHNWLRSFNAVVREGSFAAAARSLNIGQPTVSTQIKALEERFDVELFYRQGHHIELTPTAQALYDITQSLFRLEEEAVELLRGSAEFEGGLLRLAGAGPFDLMEIVQAFKAANPKTSLTISLSTHSEMIAALRDFQIDAAVFGHKVEHDDIHCQFFDSHEVLIMVPANHPWASRKFISMRDLVTQTVILRHPESATRQAVELACASAKLTIEDSVVINSREAVREAVIRGLGVGPVSEKEYVADDNLRTVKVKDAKIETSAYVACLKRRLTRHRITTFFDVVNRMIGIVKVN